MTEVKEEKTAVTVPDYSGKTITDVFPGYFRDLPKNKWDVPCPHQSTPDIKDDHAINEWAFNHLALTDRQKEWLKSKLILDAATENRKKRKEMRAESMRELRKREKKQEKKEQKISVKEITK